jgi:hypothetical protein
VTTPATLAGFESPSLAARDRADDAFELKFLIDELGARHVEEWARRRLVPDPHGESALSGAYRVTSLYCDTSRLDVFHRSPSYRRRKFRVRRYGDADWAFLERKSKWAERVAKRRTAVLLDELPQLSNSLALLARPDYWFHRRLLRLDLSPACRIAYERNAFVGAGLRLTLDRHVRGMLENEWDLAPVDAGLPLLNGQVILEFKFFAALPVPFKELVADLRLKPAAVSKYRLCRTAWGATAAGEVASA